MSVLPVKSVIRQHLVVAALLLSACGGSMDEAQMLQQAKSYLQQNQVRNAIIELKNTLQANPENAEARYLLGELNLNAGNMAAAEKEFQRALSAGWPAEQAVIGKLRAMVEQRKYREVLADETPVDGWTPRAQANRLALQATALAGLGDTDAANQRLQAAQAQDDSAYDVLKATVQLQLLAGQNEAAGETLEKALTAYPDDPALLLLRANQLIHVDKRPQAIATYQQIIDAARGGAMSMSTRNAQLGLLKLATVEKNYKLAHKALAALRAGAAGDPEVNHFGAVLAYEEKDYDKAIEYLQQVLKVAPSHAPSLLLAGASNYARKDFEQAEHYLSRYVVTNPESSRARKLLGRTYMALGQFREAHREFQAALKQHPDDAELIALVGLSEINSGQVQSGIDELEKALAIAPDSASLKQQLARAYIAKGQTDEAIRQLDEVLKNNDAAYQARYMKVFAYIRDNKIDAARQTAREMLAVSPDNADVLTLLGNVEVVAGDKKKARDYYNQALKINDAHTGAEMNLAKLDEAAGDVAAAEQHYRAIIQKKPDDPRAMINLARLAGQQKDTAGQVKWLEAARQADRKDLVSRISLVEIYLRQNNIANAEAIIRELEESHAGAPALLAVKGRLYMKQKRYTEAESVFSELINARPEQDLGYYLQAQNMILAGETQAALNNLRKAHKLKPDSIRNSILLARVEQAAGNYDRAMTLADEVIKAVPDSAAGYVLRGDAQTATKQYRAGLQSYDKAWSISPAQDIAVRRFKVTRRLASADQAYPILEKWLATHPDDMVVALELARAYEVDKRNDKAIQYYEKVLKAKPESEHILNNLAWLYGLKNDARAVGYAEKAYQLNAKSPGIMDTYGWVLLNKAGATQEELREAAGLIRQAAEALPDIPEIQYHYAVSLMKTGREDEGRKQLEELVNSDRPFEGRDDAV
ncbi:MAG TPA: PEP-CTERM system TPR-repeat protein PrsT, partial [Thiotrichales bacterium]|nr:PEP-CTERM system TPR-repeat protein PrsT [Thiotrichales bacterium]